MQEKLLFGADAATTSRSRKSAWKNYARFMSLYKLSPGFAQSKLMAYTTWCYSRGLAYNTIRAYVSSLSSFAALQGISLSISQENFPILFRLFKGIRRSSAPPKQKKGFTPLLLEQMRQQLDFNAGYDLALWACFCLGFATFLRSNNLVPRGGDLQSGSYLKISDIELKDWGLLVAIRKSKTHQFLAEPIFIPVISSITCLCPIKALRELREFYPGKPDEPLFSFAPGVFLDYDQLLFSIKDLVEFLGLNPLDYGTHSIRRGGATFSAAAGVDPIFIKLQGLWKSDAYLLYAKISLERRIFSLNLVESALSNKQLVSRLGLSVTVY